MGVGSVKHQMLCEHSCLTHVVFDGVHMFGGFNLHVVVACLRFSWRFLKPEKLLEHFRS